MIRLFKEPPLLSGKTLRVGWSIYWRVYLTLIPAQVAGGFLIRMVKGGGLRDAMDLASLFLFPFALFLLSWATKVALRRHGESAPAGFIGWSVFWRCLLMGAATIAMVSIPTVLLALALVTSFKQDRIALLVAILVVPLYMVAVILSKGWAALRVQQRFLG